MKIRIYLLFFVTYPCFLFGMPLSLQDTCAVNDFCSSAIDLPVFNDQDFYCITGCTDQATPEVVDNFCSIGYSPTVWYKIFTDSDAEVMNIRVKSENIKQINITLFLAVDDCDHLQQVELTSADLDCVQGFDGEAKAIGNEIGANSLYYIAITDVKDIGGTFELCVNTLSFVNNCVVSRNIEITNRSSVGALEGPYEPGETISVCFNVNSYTAVGNSCQWFQGLVPVFGNGWDPASFDSWNQPLNATINGSPIGANENGNYGMATWDWFGDVDFHFDNTFLQIADLDGNGTVDMCNSLYDPDCPNLGGTQGACCGPCWGAHLGTILPPGWFAYGINGTCPTPGPPIRVDWGDGNTCGGGMGPWKFCFDLVTRSFPDCDVDKTTRDLSLGFFTFTDGDVGSWTGTSGFCYDQPAYWRPGLQCRTITDLGTVTLPDQCSDNLVSYELFEPGIEYWEWTVTPWQFVLDTVFEGQNGHILQSYPNNPGPAPRIIIYDLTGHHNSGNIVIKKIQYRVWPAIYYDLPNDVEICEQKPGKVIITPSEISGGKPPLHYLWNPGGDTLSSITLSSPFQPGNIYLSVFDTIGCITHDSIQIKLKSCDFDEMYPEDAPNDTIHIPNPSANDGNFSKPGSLSQIHANSHQPRLNTDHQLPNTDYQIYPIQIYPSPNFGSATIKWSFALEKSSTISIYNLQGILIETYSVSMQDRNQKHIDTQSLDSGVYVISFSNGDFRYVTRMVKM